MNKKKRLGLLQNKRCNFYHKRKTYFKDQLFTFLERNEYSPQNINQRYVLTFVALPIIQRDMGHGLLQSH